MSRLTSRRAWAWTLGPAFIGGPLLLLAGCSGNAPEETNAAESRAERTKDSMDYYRQSHAKKGGSSKRK